VPATHGDNRPTLKARAQALPEVHFSDYGNIRYLHLGSEWVQGSMRLDAPFEIELEYLQRMMAWLLFVDPASVAGRHAMQLGLGSGALTKFCRKRLRMKTTAVELNPQVVAACRTWFKLPPPDAKLQVVLGDAAEVVRAPEWQGRVDAVQDDAAFYADCRRLLTDDGCMTVNLFGRSSSFEKSVERIAAAFGADALWAFRPTREGNTIVAALRHPARIARAELAERAATLQTRWRLPAAKWLRVFKPLELKGNLR